MCKAGHNNSFLDRIISFIGYGSDKLEDKICRWGDIGENSRLKWILVIGICGLILLLLNILTPMIADDFCYLFIYDQYDTKVSSLSDIVLSQKNHYYLWGGRSVVHFIAQVLLLLPPLVIDILNTLVYLAYVVLIYLIIRGNKQNSLILFILINIAVWFVQPAFGDTVLWITGSANYLWGTVLILLFILPYRLYGGTEKRNILSVLISLCFFIFGIIAGWTNENTAAGMIVATVLFFFYFRSNGWKIPLWGVFGLMGALVGYLFMIMAPGNQARAGDATSFSLFVISYRTIMHTQSFIVNCGALNVLGIILLALFRHYTKKGKRDVLKLVFIFGLATLAGVYSMILSPSFPPRAWFGVITFNIITVGLFLYNLNYSCRELRQIRAGLLFAGIVAFLFSFYTAIKDVSTLYNVTKQRGEIARQAKAQGLPYCEFERYIPKTKFVHMEDPKAYEFMYGYYNIDIRFKE